MITIPKFKTKKELFKYLVENKQALIEEKKSAMKTADGILFASTPASFFDEKSAAFKANVPVNAATLGVLKTRLVINTTNWMDSHDDVHIPGIWKKNLSESSSRIMHVQEHTMKFDHIISSGKDLKVKVEKLLWTELGQPYPGTTEALVFYSDVKKSRNPYMFEQYAEGYVNNHSVGMQYVALVLCINDEDPYYGAEKEAWDKYYPMIVNSEVADERGYFWAVKEARAIEGSAVPIGSNIVTPTLENNKSEDFVPGNHTEKDEPQRRTRTERLQSMLDKLK